eukprot:TRINITY_DN3031_c0_g1_i11.p1 TRINITY_DN3031_c0_g1~~TRINITY_DN3031_c0_g1_i11.p1  ORF type:complete len:420 (-),score=104.82 TRINITY_DN3031_c0_g1_i11:112-1371(-)
MEFAEGGDLLGKIKNHTRCRSSFSEDEVVKMFVQMVAGLKALHDRKILHRDIKCANIFLTKSNDVKLGDLNVSKVAKQGLLYTQTGTPYYASPEVWQDKPYGAKSDIWSLGCVLYEAVALRPPFMATDMKGLYQKVTIGKYPDIPGVYSNNLRELIKRLLQINPVNRPSCDQILKMPMLEKQARELLAGVGEQESANMLGTIMLPRNLKVLTDRLPKANYKTPMKRSPSIGALEKKEAAEENKIPRYQQRRYSIERGEDPQTKQEGQHHRKYGYNPVVQARAELNRVSYEKPAAPSRPQYHYPPSTRNERSLERPSSMQNLPPAPLYRIAGSVESVHRQQLNRGVADYYRANPVGVGINLKGLERNLDAKASQPKKPPLPFKNERPPLPHPVYQANPIKQAGQVVVQKPLYRVNPSWWG